MPLSSNALNALVAVFESNFRDRGELGASVSVWQNGHEILSLGHGWCERERERQWNTGTMAPVYSATKVPAATCLLLALQQRGMCEQTPVRKVWPQFPLAEATFGQLLSHQCGLAALNERVDVFDHKAVVAAIESQLPHWQLGDGHGYHTRTYSALLEEPLRRLTGLPLGDFWREEIADPLGLDFWIGLPASEFDRVATLYPGKATQHDLTDGFYKALTTPGTFTRQAFASPHGLHAVSEMNEPKAWKSGLPALGGVGTATALAKFYQAAIGSISSPLPDAVQQALKNQQSCAQDRVLLRRTTFTCGAQKDPLGVDGQKLRQIYGPSLHAFGHPGAGGSHAFADPESGISFAYVMNQMNLSVMPGDKCLKMVGALFAN